MDQYLRTDMLDIELDVRHGDRGTQVEPERACRQDAWMDEWMNGKETVENGKSASGRRMQRKARGIAATNDASSLTFPPLCLPASPSIMRCHLCPIDSPPPLPCALGHALSCCSYPPCTLRTSEGSSRLMERESGEDRRGKQGEEGRRGRRWRRKKRV